MNSLARSIVGVAVTAAAVFLLDPVSGRERRLLLQDRCKRAARSVDLGTRGARRQASGRYFASRANAPVKQRSDRAVSKSVRGVVRHSVSHPETIAVAVDHGHVFLRGDLQSHEHQRLLDEIRRQPGVLVITDHLSEHHGNGEYALEHGRVFRSAAGPTAWGMTGRVLVGCAGGAMLIWGIRERKALGEFGGAIAEEFHRAMDHNGHGRSDQAKDAAQAAGRSVEEGVEWAEATSADVIEEYAQQRRRQPNVADATH